MYKYIIKAISFPKRIENVCEIKEKEEEKNKFVKKPRCADQWTTSQEFRFHFRFPWSFLFRSYCVYAYFLLYFSLHSYTFPCSVCVAHVRATCDCISKEMSTSQNESSKQKDNRTHRVHTKRSRSYTLAKNAVYDKRNRMTTMK